MLGLQLNNRFLGVGLRVIVGATFLIAGIAKLPMHPEWVEVMLAYKILSLPLIKPYIAVIPWLEITIGACLILGLFIRFFSLVSIPIIASFIGGNVIALLYSLSEGCGCFGELIAVSHKGALVIDALLLIGVLLIFFQRKHFMTLDSRVTRLIRSKR